MKLVLTTVLDLLFTFVFVEPAAVDDHEEDDESRDEENVRQRRESAPFRALLLSRVHLLNMTSYISYFHNI